MTTPTTDSAPISNPSPTPAPSDTPDPFDANDSEAPPAAVSPDPETVTPDAPSADPAPETAPAPEANLPTPEQIAALQDKARQFDQLDADPEVVQLIANHYRNKGVDVPEIPTAPDVNPDIMKQLQMLQQTQQQLHAEFEISKFQNSHPDLDQYREVMGTLINEHPTMTLQKAYDFAKLTEAQKAGGGGARTPLAAPEGQQISPVDTSHEPSTADLEAKLRDPAVTKNTEQAFRQAWDAALAKEQARTE